MPASYTLFPVDITGSNGLNFTTQVRINLVFCLGSLFTLLIIPIITSGYTPGKAIFQMKIVKSDAMKASIISYAVRELLIDIITVTLISIIFIIQNMTIQALILAIILTILKLSEVTFNFVSLFFTEKKNGQYLTTWQVR
ncbi:MAG: hypothetical protein ACOCXT_05265 [Candidatus Dojkabacteria bacterium]